MNPIARIRRSAVPLHAWLLAGLLLAAQGLGLAHGVAHAQGSAGVFSMAGAQGHGDDHNHGHDCDQAHGHGQVAISVWDHHHEAGSADCRLIDQLAHADGMPCAGLLPEALPVSTAVPASAGCPAPRATPNAAYCARAPPQ